MLNVFQVKKVTQFPWTCKLAVHSFGITSLGAIWAISGCGYCSHHRVTSEMWVRSWHRFPACWVISLTCGMCCFASTPGPFPLCHVFYPGFLFRFFLVFIYGLICWAVDLSQAHQSMLRPRVNCINFSFAIIPSVGESPTGERVEKPLLCALVPGMCLVRLDMSRQHWEPRREMGKHGSDSLNQGGLGDAVWIDSLPVEHNTSWIWAEAEILMVWLV